MQRVDVGYTVDILALSCMAHPSGAFAAMRGEGSYPIKAFFNVANDTVMGYMNIPGIVDALMNQDLVMAFETNKAFPRNDGMLLPDADWNLDPKQGLPNLRGGIHAKVEKLPAKGR